MKPGEKKDFKDVQFEVRLDHREWENIDIKALQEEPGYGEVEQESDEEKNARLASESNKKVDQIENKQESNSGMYWFYQMFLIFSMLTFLLAIISIGLLIYQVV